MLQIVYRTFVIMLLSNFVYVQSSLANPMIDRKQNKLVLPFDTISDPYQWLETADKAEIIPLVKQENGYTDAFLSSERNLQQTLLQEMKARLAESKKIKIWQQQGVFYRQSYTGRYPLYEKQASDKKWQTIIDGNKRAVQFSYYNLLKPIISPNQKMALIIEDIEGDEQYQFAVLDLENGHIQQELQHVMPSAVWTKDNQAIYYLQRDQQFKLGLYLHRIGQNQQQDSLIYQEQDRSFFADVSLSSSGQYLILSMNNATQSEVRLIDLTQDNATLQLVLARQPKLEYYLDHSDDGFYVRSNFNQHSAMLHNEFALFHFAKLGEDWQPVFVPVKASELESFTLLKNWVVVRLREKGVSNYLYWQKSTPEKRYHITFPTENYLVFLQGIENDEILNFGYSSVSTPTTSLLFDLTRDQFISEISEKAQAYHTQYLYVEGRDGVLIPVTLAYKKSLFVQGKNPLLITGYGSYGFSFEPTYGTSYLSLLDRGFVFAIAHVRGGGELGSNWYQQGKGIYKTNSINDLIDVTRWLQQQGYADPDRTYATGESAGGLLVAAAVNQDPSLYRAVVLQVPLLDLFANKAEKTSGEQSQESQEWGDVNDQQQYQKMKSYSPYQNITKQRYPAVLLITGLNDSRVPFWQSLKFAAKLRYQQAEYKQPQPVLMRIENTAGHQAGSGRLGRILRNVEAYSFLLKIDHTFLAKKLQDSGLNHIKRNHNELK